MKANGADRAAYWKGIKYLYANASARQAADVLRIDRRPILIGGCGRSGTTLLLAVLSCHPAIVAIDEETRAFCPGGYLADPTLDAPFKFKKLYHHIMARQIPDRAMHWCEKTPKNVLYFQRLLNFYGEGVRMLQIVRDGRDVVVSRHPSDPTKFWVTPQRWVTDLCAGLKLAGHPQVLTIRYEDLLLDYAKTVGRICRFLGLSHVKAFDEFPRHATTRRNAAWSGRIRPLYTDTLGTWQQPAYQKRMDEFHATPGAKELLRYYGYEIDASRDVRQGRDGAAQPPVRPWRINADSTPIISSTQALDVVCNLPSATTDAYSRPSA